MEYTIDMGAPLAWNAKGHNRVLQNVANLIRTFQYEVAYDRLLIINLMFSISLRKRHLLYILLKFIE